MDSENQRAQILQGDALTLMQEIRKPIFDAITTDPPYSSGGRTLAEKQQGTAMKYTSTKSECIIPDFDGDSLDQRSWTRWIAEILLHLAAKKAFDEFGVMKLPTVEQLNHEYAALLEEKRRCMRTIVA